jgi:hypothetical protein
LIAGMSHAVRKHFLAGTPCATDGNLGFGRGLAE